MLKKKKPEPFHKLLKVIDIAQSVRLAQHMTPF